MEEGGLDGFPFWLLASSSETTTCNKRISEREQQGISDCELYHPWLYFEERDKIS